MISVNNGLYVRIKELEGKNAPVPKPLANGFTDDLAYLVLGAMNESAECYLVLSNNENQIWFISNRHLRTHDYDPTSTDLRKEIK